MVRTSLAQVSGRNYDVVGNTFYINNIGDLSSFLVGSTYELPQGKYIFAAAIDFGTDNIDLVDEDGCYVFNSSCPLALHSYTGVPSFITTSTTGINLFLDYITFFTPNATCIDVANGATFFCHVANFVALKAASINAFGFVTLETAAMVGCADGMTFTNITDKIAAIEIQWNGGTNAGGNAIRVAGTAPPIISITGVDSRPAATEAMFYLENTWTGDAVITNGVHSTTTGGVFFNASGKDGADVDVIVDDVRNVSNSSYFASATLGTVHISGVPVDNTEETIISATDSPVKVLVNTGVANEEWRSVGLERWTLTADGRLTYVGKEAIGAGVSAVVTIDPVGGGTDNMGVYIAKNGTVIEDSLGKASGSTESQLGSVIFVPMVTNDYLEIYVANFSDTSNLIVATGKFTASG